MTLEIEPDRHRHLGRHRAALVDVGPACCTQSNDLPRCHLGPHDAGPVALVDSGLCQCGNPVPSRRHVVERGQKDRAEQQRKTEQDNQRRKGNQQAAKQAGHGGLL